MRHPVELRTTRRGALTRLLAIAATVAISACFGPEPTVDGEWTAESTELNIYMTLTQEAQTVAGTGLVEGGSDTGTVTITGSYDEPTLSITLTATGITPLTFSGELDGDRISGLANGSGYTNHSLTFRKQ